LKKPSITLDFKINLSVKEGPEHYQLVFKILCMTYFLTVLQAQTLEKFSAYDQIVIKNLKKRKDALQTKSTGMLI